MTYCVVDGWHPISERKKFEIFKEKIMKILDSIGLKE